jgi:glycosyltransferase involved in cell wall biosynthesis
MTELTILMPCLNEAATVGGCVTKARAFLERFGIDGEVLVADNCSKDGSQEVAERAGETPTTVTTSTGSTASSRSCARAIRSSWAIALAGVSAPERCRGFTATSATLF